MLWDSLKGNIQIEEKVGSWEESIRVASLPLLKKGVIEERYVDAMISTIRKLGFFVVLREYVAMPHARPEDGAKGTGISLLKVSSPVRYGKDDIHLIFILASKDTESHRGILMELAELFQDDESIGLLLREDTYEGIEGIIRKFDGVI